MNKNDNRRSSQGVRNLAAEAAMPSYEAENGSVGSPKRHTALRGMGINRSPLAVTLIPLALLFITCGLSAVHRATAAITHPEPTGPYGGRMTADEASQDANSLCSRFTGAPSTIKDVSEQSAYSWRRHTIVREWNVLCDSANGEYLMRINADTKRVYAINRMDLPAAQGTPDDDGGPISRAIAEQRARQYLNLIGIPSETLKPIRDSDVDHPVPTSSQAIPQWNFTYRHHVPGLGDRLLKVSVNGESGGLEHVWNPVSAM